MKIIKIKRRHPLIRMFTINHWEVTVEYEGEVKKYNVWANTGMPKADSLLWDLASKIKESDDMPQDFQDLIGKEINI